MKFLEHLKVFFLWMFALVWMLPVISLAMTAIRPLREIRAGWWNFSSVSVTFQNFSEAWESGMADYFQNTFFVAVVATILPLFVGSMAAFGITKFRVGGTKALYAFFLSTMLLPVQLILIPLFPWLIQLQLNDSLWGLIFVHAAFGMGWTVFHLVNFFKEIPGELMESAQMDGAKPWTTFIRIVLPLGLPALISYSILQFIWVWNDLLLALILIQTPQKYPITVGLVNLQSPLVPQWGVLAAGSLLAIVPPIALFLVLQRFYGAELFKGAVK